MPSGIGTVPDNALPNDAQSMSLLFPLFLFLFLSISLRAFSMRMATVGENLRRSSMAYSSMREINSSDSTIDLFCIIISGIYSVKVGNNFEITKKPAVETAGGCNTPFSVVMNYFLGDLYP